jgi:hypothetical protein
LSFNCSSDVVVVLQPAELRIDCPKALYGATVARQLVNGPYCAVLLRAVFLSREERSYEWRSGKVEEPRRAAVVLEEGQPLEATFRLSRLEEQVSPSSEFLDNRVLRNEGLGFARMPVEVALQRPHCAALSPKHPTLGEVRQFLLRCSPCLDTSREHVDMQRGSINVDLKICIHHASAKLPSCRTDWNRSIRFACYNPGVCLSAG